MSAPPLWVAPYVGVPFCESGFTRSGCHCWGLVHLIYREVAGIDLPRYDPVLSADHAGCAAEMQAAVDCGPWRAVADRPSDLDVVLMSAIIRDLGRLRRYACHVGVVVGESHLLHVEPGTESVCIPLNFFSIRRRVIGFYRHASR